MVHAADGHAVGLEGTGDEEDTLLKLAKEHDALAAETTGEKDQDCSGNKRFTVFRGVRSLAGLCRSFVLAFYFRHILHAFLVANKDVVSSFWKLHVPSSFAPPPRLGSTWMPSGRPLCEKLVFLVSKY